MSGGSGIKDDLREHYTPLPAGTVLWHVYPSKYAPRAFNPSSRNRFALVPPPNQAMFYAGDSSACALWEAVLRNLVVDYKQPQHVDPAIVEGRSIAQLKLLQEIPILDLRAPHFRNISANSARHTEWQRLCIMPERDYDQTHAAARELLTVAPRAAGLSWHSRQITAQTAYVFYSPPLKPPAEFEVIDTIVLDQAAGWALIDHALKIVGVERMGASALVKEIVDELPPEELDDG
jgi:RES domain